MITNIERKNKMKIKDSRYNGSQLEVSNIMNFSSEEQETTITAYRNDKTMKVYTSDSTYITKILKLASHEDVKVLTVSKAGKITSLECILDKKNVLLRAIPKTCKSS